MRNNKILFLSFQDVINCLPMKKAISVMKDAFIDLSLGKVDVPLRTRIELNDNNDKALFMPVHSSEISKIGLKTVTIFNDNLKLNLPSIHALVTIFDGETGKPIAVLDGEALTAIRTGAASGLATSLLANEGANSVFVIGTGIQARYQLQAMIEVRSIQNIWAFDLNTSQLKQFVAEMSESLQIQINEESDTSRCIDADIICTATSSSIPVFSDSQIKPGTHINGIGSYTPQMQEIPGQTVKRSVIVVDSKKSCLAEAGDILRPIEKGLFSKNHIHGELGEIIDGKKSGRINNDQITFFKSVGNAVQDLYAASEIIKYATKNEIGTSINL